MKVLWYSLSPCGSMRRDRVNRYIQGWMISLEDEIKKNKEIELSGAFFSIRKEEPFKFEGVHYYPIFMPISKNKIGRIVGRYKSYKKVDLQFLPEMLKIIEMVKP